MFTVTEVTTVVVVLLYNCKVNVPVGTEALLATRTATPEIVIAPGVNVDEATAEVVSVVVPACEFNKEVVSTTPHVEAEVKLPDCIECNVAIKLY